MTQSLLQGKKFFCRDWAFAKIVHCLESKPSSKTQGALVIGGPGSGKTAFCCEIIWPTAKHGKQHSLGPRVMAYYFCQAHDTNTLSLSIFIRGLVDQISASSLVTGYGEKVRDEEILRCLSDECLRNPDEVFKKAVLFPLLEIDAPKHTCFLLVDSIDESFLQPPECRVPGGSSTIAELLANNHHLFPPWLYLVCSARKQSKNVTRLFTGFRKISMDDLRKSHVVRDVQQYILSRLDEEDSLRHHLSKETAEMLNQLHIKSNGCFLYIEKVLDGIAENFIILREIREIPGTLNGLYLWLCQRLFVKKQFSRVQHILNVLLATRRPLSEDKLYECVKTRNINLTREEFDKKLCLLSELIITGQNGTRILFHHSFAEWLLDVKHCTQKYLCQAHEGHAMLAMWYTLNAENLTQEEVNDFALHLSKVQLPPPFHQHHLPLWLMASNAPVQDVLHHEPRLVKLLVDAGARLPSPQHNSVKSNMLHSDPLQDLLNDANTVNRKDANERTLLHAMAYEGNLDCVVKLIEKGIDVESVDKGGQTALNLAARQGHASVVEQLLKAAANPDHADNDGWTPLRSAAWAGHTEVVVSLLEYKAKVDLIDSDQRTALRAAAWGGHEEVVVKLLENGANVNLVDNEGRTSLIAAAYMGHQEIVEQLLVSGADINHQDADGRTALSVAALSASGVVSLLLERGADVDHVDKDGMTPLLVAAFEGHSEVCEFLLEADADVDHADNNSRTPLFAAASTGHPSVVNLLLFWGGAVDTIDPEGRTVLSLAAAQGDPDTVRQLLDRGLDEQHRDNGGWTPLHYAAFEGHLDVCDLLLEAAAKPSEIDNDGRIPMMLSAQEGHVNLVKRFLEHTPSLIDHRSHDGKTALRIASLEGQKETVEILLQKGADMNYQDADGRSTLYLLALDNKVPLAEMLLIAGAELEAVDLEGRTALHVAAWQGHHEMVDILLLHRAMVDAVDHEQRTALQSAAWQGHNTVVRHLLQRNSNVDHTCNQGATALCIAAQEGHEQVVRTLLEFGADPNHADQFGRNPLRVALKGGHTEVIKLLEEAMNNIQDFRKYSGSISTSSLTSASTGETKPCSASLVLSQPILTLESTASQKRKSCMSNPSSSKSSSNLSTRSSHVAEARIVPTSILGPMTFTQQLQQCTRGRNRVSHVLSPLSEPESPPLSPTSPPNDRPSEDGNKPKRNGIVTNPNFKVAPMKSAKPFKNRYYLETIIDPSVIPFKKETPL